MTTAAGSHAAQQEDKQAAESNLACTRSRSCLRAAAASNSGCIIILLLSVLAAWQCAHREGGVSACHISEHKSVDYSCSQMYAERSTASRDSQQSHQLESRAGEWSISLGMQMARLGATGQEAQLLGCH